MKTQLITVSAALTLLGATQSQAGIAAISDNFSDSLNTFSNWTSVGAFPTLIQHESTSLYDYDKNDLINSQANPLDGDGIVGNLTGDTEPTGDGLLNDGGLIFNSQDAIAGNEAIGLTLGGTMSLGEQYNLTMSFYNDNNSYWNGKIQLFNLTTSSVLAETANMAIKGYTDAAYQPLTWTLGYTAQAADVGDLLQIRVVENANNVARDGYVDNFALTVTSVPEPSTFALVAAGFGLLLLISRRRAGLHRTSGVE